MQYDRVAILVAVSFWVLYFPANAEEYAPPEPAMEVHAPMRALTSGPESHWFAYYDKHQFDAGNRYVLGMRVGFEDRAPSPDDAIVLGMIDLKDGDKWIPFATSTAWCWQQGCMLQWLPGSDSEVIYNAREADRYIAVIQDVFTGEKRTLPHPVYTVSADGKTAVGLNFARVGETRPGYGYNGIPDSGADQLHPADDGIYSLDLTTGESRLIVTLNQIVAFRADDTMDKGKHWFNHLLFNPDGTRFIFLHRCIASPAKDGIRADSLRSRMAANCSALMSMAWCRTLYGATQNTYLPGHGNPIQAINFICTRI